jgi:hypothetical protein
MFFFSRKSVMLFAASTLFSCLIAQEVPDERVKQSIRFGVSIQVNNYAQQVSFVDDFYTKILWSPKGNANKIGYGEHSLGISTDYFLKDGSFVRFNVFYGKRSWSSLVDTIDNFISNSRFSEDKWNASQAMLGMNFGYGHEVRFNKMNFYGGLIFSLFLPGDFENKHHYKYYEVSASSWGWCDEWSSRSVLEGEPAYGPGILSGFNVAVFRDLRIGGELTWSYLYTHLKYYTKPETTVIYNHSYNPVGDKEVKYDQKFFRPSSIGGAIALSYTF